MTERFPGGAPITSERQLAEWIAEGEKPDRTLWRIGTEHEKFGFHTADCSPLPYDGPSGIRAMLEGMRDQFDWQPLMEGEHIIGLKCPRTGGSISLEPGGQFELSGAPLETVHQTCSEVHTHLAQVRDIAEPLGIGFLGVGFSPLWKRAEIPIMPKGRYNIMRAYMPKVGSLGLDMMLRTSTVQVNLDFADEADMVEKIRIGLALQPLSTAIFANSPFTEGKPNGHVSYRSAIWADVDGDRTGMLPFAFEDGFGFERYTQYALDVPMYFVYRQGAYHDATGVTFRQYMAGGLRDRIPGAEPTFADWENHLSTIFPEVRLKRFLEMRGADGGPWRRLCALPAFWVGLLYDASSQAAALDVIKDWSAEDRETLRQAVPKEGLKATIKGRPLREVGLAVLDIAREGMKNRRNLDGSGEDESRFLDTIEDVVGQGRTPAEDLLAKYNGEWGGDILRLFAEEAY
ncbi:MAG: glutamate--cysteine ligase [Pseudomonadota bacterium]